MNIGIDLRTLLNPLKTGVGEYASELITHILMSNRGHDFFLYYNAAFTASHLEVFTSFPHTHLVATHIPNKLMNSSTVLLGRPHIDRLIRRATGSTIDFFFSPNLNITALSPNMPHVLTIHDISYEFFPHFFSQKQRLWHKAVNPRALARQARAIITPSTHTAHDVCDYYNIDPTLIHVIPPGLATEFKTSLDKLSPNDITRITATYNLPARYLLFLGTIEPRKNIPTLIKAFEHYVNHYNDNENHLVIAGAPGWNSKAFYSALLVGWFQHLQGHD